jgi:hypothetical protein
MVKVDLTQKAEADLNLMVKALAIIVLTVAILLDGNQVQDLVVN